MKKSTKQIIGYVLLIAVVVGVVALLTSGLGSSDVTYQEVVSLFREEQVKEFTLDNSGTLELQTVDGKKIEYKIWWLEKFEADVGEDIDRALEDGTLEKYDLPTHETPAWLSYLPFIIVILLMVAMWIFMIRQASGKGGAAHNFGKAKAKAGADEKSKVYFKDVAGCDEEKEELVEIVEFLRDPQKFTRLGAKIPHGVLLVGPPGTGKTLLAKAVAGEAGVPFYSISGSDFVEMYVGVGASRVRDLFETARKSPAAIIFIDEIDAVGRHRGAGLGGGHDEREQTLNQLLVEMDGFAGNEGVIVMAATNRPDILDPALLRPGRFDRQVTVNTPNLRGRVDILKVHSRGKPLEQAVDLERVAQMTVGFTGADLANLMNEAALLAAKKGKSLIGMNDIEQAALKVMVGTDKKSFKMKERERENTAYHEAGHAILDYYQPTQDPVRRISIIPSSKGALGYTLSHPEEDKYSVYKQELKENIASLLGGRVAEELIFGDFSGGASNDIQRATQIARKMVTQLGMSDLGPILYGSEHGSDEVFLGRDFSAERTYSEETAAKIDAEIKKIIDEAYARAREILTEHLDKLHFVAKFLIKYEVMDDEQFKVAMEKDNPTFEELDAMVAEKRRVSEEENRRMREIEEEETRRREAELAERDRAYRESMQNGNPPPPQNPGGTGNPGNPGNPGSQGGQGGQGNSPQQGVPPVPPFPPGFPPPPWGGPPSSGGSGDEGNGDKPDGE